MSLKFQDNLIFLQWFKKFFDKESKGRGWGVGKIDPSPQFGWLTTNKKVNDTLVRDWNSWWSLVRDKNHVMGDECSFDGWLLMDVLILIFPTPTGREMNMTQWRLDMGPPWVRGALEAHFGALVDGLTIIGGEDFAHICTHTVKSVSISEMLESAATDHRTPLQSRILLSNQSGKQVKHQQLLSTNVQGVPKKMVHSDF